MMFYDSCYIYDMISNALDREIVKTIRENAEVKKTIFDEIKDVRFNDPATIIFWKDNTKTVVKAQGEPYDKEKGFAMAICKKIMGNTGKFNEEFKKWNAVETEPKKICKGNCKREHKSLREEKCTHNCTDCKSCK